MYYQTIPVMAVNALAALMSRRVSTHHDALMKIVVPRAGTV
jgi:hypothetical protein